VDLSESELVALRNLSQKRLGQEVAWISISDARALTELGLAMRNRGGWEITDLGEAALLAVGNAAGPEAKPDNVSTMTPPDPDGRRG
jgi:hypothetical protein